MTCLIAHDVSGDVRDLVPFINRRARESHAFTSGIAKMGLLGMRVAYLHPIGFSRCVITAGKNFWRDIGMISQSTAFGSRKLLA
jgi:hypothetical protein